MQDGVGSEARDQRRRRITPLFVLLVLLALLVVAFALPVLLINSSVVRAQVRERVLPRLSQQLGREVSVGDFEVAIFPRPIIRLQEVRIAGVGGGLPLIEAESAVFGLRLLPLVLSRGRNVEVRGVVLQEPVVNLVRAPDGTWNYEGLFAPETERQVVIETLRIDDGVLRIVDRAGGGRQTAVALRRIEAVATDLGRGRPFELELQAALASEERNVSLAFAREGEGGTGSLDIESVALDALDGLLPAGLGNLLAGGTVSLDSDIASPQGGGYEARGSARLESLSLRGEPAGGSLDFVARSTPGKPGLTLALEDILLEGPGTRLGGSATFSTSTLRGSFDIWGQRLALDAILGALPEREPEADELLPAATRQRLERAAVQGVVAIDRVTSGKLVADELAARVELRRGVLEVRRANAKLYGGTVRIGGAEIDLRQPVPPWNLDARLESVNLERALTALSGAAPVTGTLAATLNLRGRGNDWARLRETLTGQGSLSVREGTFHSFDMRDLLAEPLARALEIIGQGVGGAGDLDGQGTTPLRDLDLAFVLRNGAMRLASPLTFSSDFGTARLSGAIRLDWRLDLTGEAFLAPQFVQDVSGGRVQPSSPLEVPVSVTGTLREPQLQVSPQAIAQEIVTSRGRGALREGADELRRRFQQRQQSE